jgi:hypothetical protein
MTDKTMTMTDYDKVSTNAQPGGSTNGQPWTETLSVDEILADPAVQQRVALDEDAIADYADALKRGVRLPPVDVVYDGEVYWLACGFHRRKAHMLAQVVDMEANVRRGTRRDAILLAARSNSKHGVRLTSADRRKAVTTLLSDAEWSRWSNMEIARRCNVSEGFVRKLRDGPSSYENEDSSKPLETLGPENRRVVQRGGQSYTITVGKIGRASRDDQDAPPRPGPEPELRQGESLPDSEPWAGPDSEYASPEYEAEVEIEQAVTVRNEIVPVTEAVQGEIEGDAEIEAQPGRALRQPVQRPLNAPLQDLYKAMLRFEATGIMDQPPNERLGMTMRQIIYKKMERWMGWSQLSDAQVI